MEEWLVSRVPGLHWWLTMPETQYRYVKFGIALIAGVTAVRYLTPIVIEEYRAARAEGGSPFYFVAKAVTPLIGCLLGFVFLWVLAALLLWPLSLRAALDTLRVASVGSEWARIVIFATAVSIAGGLALLRTFWPIFFESMQLAGGLIGCALGANMTEPVGTVNALAFGGGIFAISRSITSLRDIVRASEKLTCEADRVASEKEAAASDQRAKEGWGKRRRSYGRRNR